MPRAESVGAPIAQPTQTGAKSVQETTTDDGTIDLLLCGYATRWGEADLAGEVMTREAFAGIKEEWGAAKRRSVAFNHGQDPAIGFRPIAECTRWRLDDVGLGVEPMPARPRAAVSSTGPWARCRSRIGLAYPRLHSGCAIETVAVALLPHVRRRTHGHDLNRSRSGSLVDVLMFKRRRRTEQELLLRDVDDVLKHLRSLCGALLLGKRRGTHAGYERWLDDAETALARLEAVRESIAHDQELRR